MLKSIKNKKALITSNRMKKLFVIVLLFCVCVPLLAEAQFLNPCRPNQPDPNLPRCVTQIYTWSLGIGTLLALLMAVFGGYTIMTAAGSGEQSAKGKEMIGSAVVGLVLLFGAYLLLRTINPDLVEFNYDSVKEPFTNDAQQPPQQPSGTRR